MKTKPEQSQTFSSVGRWCWQRRSSLATLLAGVAILVLSAASGYMDHTESEGVSWLALSIYLCAVVVVATQGARLARACVSIVKRPAQWLRDRTGGGSNGTVR